MKQVDSYGQFQGCLRLMVIVMNKSFLFFRGINMRYLGKVASILSLRADLEHVYVSRFCWLIYGSTACKVAGAVKGYSIFSASFC